MCSESRILQVACDIVEGLHQAHEPVLFKKLDELIETLRLRVGTTVHQVKLALEMLRTTKPHATVVLIGQPGRGTQVLLYDLVPA